MPIAELFLGTFLQVLFDRLASQELLAFAKREGIDTQLNEWKKILESIEVVLDDAEDKLLTGHLEEKTWLKDFRNLAYNIKDLLDEFTIEFIESKSQAEPSTSKAHSLLPNCCFGLSPRALTFEHRMRSEIEKMDNKLQNIKNRKDVLNLIEKDKQSAYRHLDETTSLPDRWFVSRKEDKSEILKWLTQEEDSRTWVDVEVIAIIGMPGVGKTALAQQVFNDASVNKYFNEKAWACISDKFDVRALTATILQKTNFTRSCKDMDLDSLQVELKKKLSGKKFLLVLDDNWNKDVKTWNEFLKPFRWGAKGSKIIVTTRDSHIANIAHAKEYHLVGLSQDDCMTLLAFHAFEVGNFNDHCDLKELGWKLAEKCKGLPLAATTLGGSLCFDFSPQRWEAVLNSPIWNQSGQSNDILSVLKLSYLRLPSNLRRCFAYCAIFPKDYAIKRDELIHLWFAEGLLEGMEQKSHWDVGLNYIHELVSRSLFQKSSNDESHYIMHDLVNDLAKLVAGATYFDSMESGANLNNAYFGVDPNDASLPRHASFVPNEYILPEKFKIYHEMKGLRSFISLDKPSSSLNLVNVSQKLLCDFLLALKYLKVLSLSHYRIAKVPESIGKLKLLRHLNLSYTYIERLPKSIIALYNLEALMLQGCELLLELPKGIEKLINLRFLDISNTRSLETMPPSIGKLVGLEMLSKFIVGTTNGSRLKELKDLNNLGGELCISNLHMVQEPTDAHDAKLSVKEGICRLTLQWSGDFENPRNQGLERKVLELLQPHQNLKNLTISFYGGLEFPLWLGRPSHAKLVHLRLHKCQRVKALPSLGQLSSLKELYIESLNAISTIEFEVHGSNILFPFLITLEFKDMPSWKDWSHCIGTEEIGVVFPRLEHLIIYRCPKLIGRLPSKLSSLIKLKIYSCPCMDALPSITSLPSLNELDFRDCNEGVLESLVNLTSLTTLVMEGISKLTCLNHGFTSSLNKLENLEIQRCTELIYLWQDRDVIRDLTCLKSLVIKSCPEFICYGAGEGDIELPSNLETIRLTNCVNLEKLPSRIHTLSSLRSLTVNSCPKLVSFPETGISTSMISLNISRCEMLQSLPKGLSVHLDEPSSSTNSNAHGDMTSCLQDLRIFQCNSLPASPFGGGRFLAATLKRLEIRECRAVESLAEINVRQSLREILIWDCANLRSLPHGLHMLSQLTSLELINCPALELECFPPLPPSISKFSLWSCPKIKSLPDELHRLTNLHHLEIRWCESITRFPDGKLPSQLWVLALSGCGNIRQPVGQWLTRLTSLKWLYICGSVGGAGEEEDLVLPLPPSLLDLRIFDMGQVKRLSGNLPPSLQKLLINYCPKLRELPQDGLPPSLEELQIVGCDGILEERCREPTGSYWHLICEIPEVAVTSARGGYSESPPSRSSSVSSPLCCPRLNRRLHH